MQLSKFNLLGDFRVQHSSSGSETSDLQIDLFKTGKVSATKAFADTYFFNLPNGSVLGSNVSNDVPVSGMFVALGDGITETFGGTIPAALRPIKVGTFSVTDGTQVLTANSSGVLAGDGTGTVDIATGVWTADFTLPPDTNDVVLSQWTRGIVTDDTLTSGFQFVLTTMTGATTGEGVWTDIVPLTVAPAKIDMFERTSEYVYKVTMTGTYSGTATTAITGVGIVFQSLVGGAAGVIDNDSIIIKSIAPAGNSIYPVGGLVLAESVVTVVYSVVVSK